MKRGTLAVVIFFLFFTAGTAFGRKILPPPEYGRVIIKNYSEKAGFAPVVFEHWLHRTNFTCRLCHVDIGFAMEAGATKITAAANSKGLYCGSCHNGERIFNDKKIFAACSEKYTQEDRKRCDRCHSFRKKVKKEYDFETFTAKLPKKGLGNGIDWEQAEAEGIIKPVDFLEGISIKRKPMKPQKDFSIKSKGRWMSDIIFSHEKHTVWNGCEGCHPDIFPSVKKGTNAFSMFQIYNGEYCGVCHDKVAFPLIECQRCHTKEVK